MVKMWHFAVGRVDAVVATSLEIVRWVRRMGHKPAAPDGLVGDKRSAMS